MDFSTEDLYTLIPDILNLYDDARLKEDNLERKLQSYGHYVTTSQTANLQQDMRYVLSKLIEKRVLITGATVDEIGKNDYYKPDLKQWIAVNKSDLTFNLIKTVTEMKDYLGNIKNSLNNTKRLYKYTNTNKILEIVKTKRWLVGHPYHLNDNYEYNKFHDWNGRFFSSFMRGDNEAIAMWSMYGQPWDQGIRIGISVSSFKKWIRNINKIYDENGSEIKKKFRVYYGDVLYANDEKKESLKRGIFQNTFFKPYDHSEMIGYVKDVAWAYEKEVRLHVDVEDMCQEKVFIDIPDEIINDLEIILSPRISKERREFCNNELVKFFIKDSKFYKLISWIYCDDCKKTDIFHKR